MSGSKNTILSTLRNAIALVWGLVIFGVIAWYLLSRTPEQPAADAPVTVAPIATETVATETVTTQTATTQTAVAAPAVPVEAVPAAVAADDGSTVHEESVEIAMLMADPLAFAEYKTARILSHLVDLGMPADQKAYVADMIRLKVVAYAQTFYKFGTRGREPLDVEFARLSEIDLKGQNLAGWVCAVDNFPAPLTAEYLLAQIKEQGASGGYMECALTPLDPQKQRLRSAAEQELRRNNKAPEASLDPNLKMALYLSEQAAAGIGKIYNDDHVVVGGTVDRTTRDAQRVTLENASLIPK